MFSFLSSRTAPHRRSSQSNSSLFAYPRFTLRGGNTQKERQLIDAVKNGNTDEVRHLILNEHVNPNIIDDEEDEETLLLLSIDNLDMLKTLLDLPQVDVNLPCPSLDGQPILQSAIYENNIDAFEEIVEHPKVNLNQRNDKGQTE